MTENIKEALQAMEANEPQANLYRAAEEYVSDQAYELMGFGDDDDFTKLAELMKQAVLYGAHWNEQQMMKDAVKYEYQVEEGGMSPFTEDGSIPVLTCTDMIQLPKEKFKVGDKVKLIIFKED